MFGILRKKKLAPKFQKVYDTELAKEKRVFVRQKNVATVEKIKSQARRDAALAQTSKGVRVATQVGRGLMRAGESFSKKVEKFDSDKFEEFVTGAKPKKRSRRSTRPSGHAG